MILSAEIMAITLATVADQSFAMQAVVLAVVGLGITVAVYGVVALIVKADDFGVALAARGGPVSRPVGRGIVKAMPGLLAGLSLVGTLAMLWVGGGIVLHSIAGYGLAGPEHAIEAAGQTVAALVPPSGGPLHGWFRPRFRASSGCFWAFASSGRSRSCERCAGATRRPDAAAPCCWGVDRRGRRCNTLLKSDR